MADIIVINGEAEMVEPVMVRLYNSDGSTGALVTGTEFEAMCDYKDMTFRATLSYRLFKHCKVSSGHIVGYDPVREEAEILA